MGKNVAIIGAGDLGITISQHLLAQNSVEKVFFIDDTKCGELINGVKVLCSIADIKKFYNREFDHLIMGIGYNHLNVRQKIFEKLKENYKFFTFEHPSTVKGEKVNIGQGSVILPGCTLDNGVSIGENTLLNTGVTIAHDSKIKGHSFIAPGVNISGFVEIGYRCFIGVGTNIIDNIKVVDDVVLGGGGLVLKNISKAGRFVCKQAGKLSTI